MLQSRHLKLRAFCELHELFRILPKPDPTTLNFTSEFIIIMKIGGLKGEQLFIFERCVCPFFMCSFPKMTNLQIQSRARLGYTKTSQCHLTQTLIYFSVICHFWGGTVKNVLRGRYHLSIAYIAFTDYTANNTAYAFFLLPGSLEGFSWFMFHTFHAFLLAYTIPQIRKTLPFIDVILIFLFFNEHRLI